MKSTWNKFNDVKELSMTVTSEADRKELYSLLSILQSEAESNFISAQDFDSRLKAVTALRSNESAYANQIVDIETKRRVSRGFYILGLVILNSVQFSYIFYLLLNFVYQARL